MTIYRDTIVRTQVFVGYKRSHKPTTIVIHGTAGGGTLNWWRYGHKTDANAERHKRGVGLTHFLIEVSGKIIEIYDPATQWVFHSSIGGLDAWTIGIELENKSSTNLNYYTESQYKSLAQLIIMLQKKIGDMEITTHNAIMQKHKTGSKNCPGRNFSFSILQNEIKKQKQKKIIFAFFILGGFFLSRQKKH